MRKLRIRLVCALLILCLALGLAACAPTTPTPTPNPNPPPNPDPQPSPDPEPEAPVVYGRGADITGAGFTGNGSAFAFQNHPIDAAGANEKSAQALVEELCTGTLGECQTYRIVDTATVSGLTDVRLDAHHAMLVIEGGLTFENCTNVTLKNLLVIGEIRLVNCPGFSMEQVDALAQTGTALTADADTVSLRLTDCRLSGKTAASLSGDESTLLDSALLFTESGLVAAGDGLTVKRCRLSGDGRAITVSGADATLMYNTVTCNEAGTGLLFAAGARNGLAAMNVFDGAQLSVAATGADNTVVVRNSLVSVQVENSIHMYVCDNEMGGRFTGDNVNYLLADGNRYPDDGKNHTAKQTDLQNINGDTLMDVNARPDVGADESLLPHVDPDQFVGIPARKTVKDVEANKELAIGNYVLAEAQNSDYVFVAPGVYVSDTNWAFSQKQNNTTVYAYGVYAVREGTPGQFARFEKTRDITVKGLTFANRQQSCGQVYVLEKLGSNKLKVITGAGMLNEFGNTNTQFSNTKEMGAQHPGTFYAWRDANFLSIQKNQDGTMTMAVDPTLYSCVVPGEVFTCRTNADSGISITKSSGISFMDFTLYGAAGALAFFEGNNDSTVTYYRVLDTTRSGDIIDKATYERYKALEDRYGISLEISVDEQGRFRGSPAHIGSIDATHVVGCTVGSTVISCLFENMCDDGTNQHASHARLAGYRDNGDGTMTITYKSNLSENNHRAGYSTASGKCADFHVGERIFIYTSRGRLVCDTRVLSATQSAGYDAGNGASFFNKYEVTIPADQFNAAALVGYDLSDNSYASANKVLVDNMSRQSNGFTFDNMVVRNIRSRALLIKASDGRIVNCTFENIGMSCAAILYEIYWGESGVTENLEVSRNLFNHTGYFKNQDLYAPVSITGLGSSVEEDYLLYKNISITDNVFKGRTTDYCVYVNSAKDITIKNNDFGYTDGEDLLLKTIHINGAMNVEISDNLYPEDAPLDMTIVCERYKNIFGTDAMDGDTPLFPDSD